MKEGITKLLDRPMDRKEFLRFSGASLLMLLGGNMIIQALGLAQRQDTSITDGYGAADYGGRRSA